MLRLKRHFDQDELAAWRAAVEAGEDAPPPKPTHLEVKEQRGERQNFSRRFVDAGIAEGWLTLSRGELILHTGPDDYDVVFKVVETPGVYCCHCGVQLAAGDETAQMHVVDEHDDGDSPDPQNPAGYRVSNAYACEVN